jgi:cell division transport system permease protein
LPKAYGVSPINDIQILSPTKKGTLGTINLNYILQNRLNPADGKKKEYTHGANVFREGDKVMQVKNNYDIEWNDVETYEDGNGIFNGDVGVIESISPSDGFMTIVFDKRKCDYDFSFLDDENPMSCAAKITMKDMGKFDETIKKIEKLSGVERVVSQSDLANTINAIKKGVGVAGFWIIAILMIIALVIVSNTIRVTMYNRKLEISIMKAVGATDAFVRIPFIVEGMIIGLISAVISEGLLYFCYRVATETIVSTLGTNDIVKYGDMALLLFGLFAGIGIFAGVIGSAIMIGKYLKREGSEFAAI